MKQQSLLPETGGQKEAFERLKAGRITLCYPFTEYLRLGTDKEGLYARP